MSSKKALISATGNDIWIASYVTSFQNLQNLTLVMMMIKSDAKMRLLCAVTSFTVFANADMPVV